MDKLMSISTKEWYKSLVMQIEKNLNIDDIFTNYASELSFS
jgi:hypothetical protein